MFRIILAGMSTNNFPKSAQFIFNDADASFNCTGRWSVHHVEELMQSPKEGLPQDTSITVSGKNIACLDSAGALALVRIINTLKELNNKIKLIDFDEKQMELIDLVEGKKEYIDYAPPHTKKHNLLYRVGKETFHKFAQIDGLIILIGNLSEKMAKSLSNWKRFQLPSVVANINLTGIQALPILALLSFLIGVVLSYQMGLQLETYGANIFIAYLSGMALFREFSPLITAIIIAGRTSSAFTAQIGNMKINEEVDAIETMGLSSVELLVTPKVLGLLIIFPLLIFWSDIFSIIGAMIMSKMMLDVSYYEFLNRINDSVGAKQMLLGLYKAPVFAILIALVGCFQGYQVESSAGSLGMKTTKSVVQALFLIIIADALYSIIYSWLDI